MHNIKIINIIAKNLLPHTIVYIDLSIKVILIIQIELQSNKFLIKLTKKLIFFPITFIYVEQ